MPMQTIDPRLLLNLRKKTAAPDAAPAPVSASAVATGPMQPPAPIAFIDLKAQQALVRDAVERRILDVLDHGAYINGPEVKELEDALCAFTGAPYALAVANGTDALVMPMMGLGIGAGDAVFLPAMTYNATANAVLMVGATPVFVDVNPNDFTMDIADLSRKIEQVKADGKLKPKMILAVDLFGIPADYAPLYQLVKAHGMFLMGDAAQSFGARYNHLWAGNIAPVTATSFFPAKPLGCYGDGGAIFFKDKGLYDICESIRWHGTDTGRKQSVRVGMNGRLDSMQCAIVTEKLKIFPDELRRRRQIAEAYLGSLSDIMDPFILPENPSVTPPLSEPGWGLFTIAIDNRDAVAQALKDMGVPTAIYYPQALHQMPAFSGYAAPGTLPQSERLAGRVLSLPMHPYLSDDQVDYIIRAVRQAVAMAASAATA